MTHPPFLSFPCDFRSPSKRTKVTDITATFSTAAALLAFSRGSLILLSTLYNYYDQAKHQINKTHLLFPKQSFAFTFNFFFFPNLPTKTYFFFYKPIPVEDYYIFHSYPLNPSYPVFLNDHHPQQTKRTKYSAPQQAKD